MKTANFPRMLILVCVAALLTAPVLVAEEAAGLLEVNLRVTSPGGAEVPISTVTDSPVAIHFDAGAGVAFVVSGAQGDLSINVVDAENLAAVIESGRVSADGSVHVQGYRFDVAGARRVASVRELGSALTP
jgi:hypothetical protein